SGRVDLTPGPGGSRITPLDPIQQQDCCAVLGLDADAVTVRLVALYPSSQLVAHTDPPIRGRRYHIPLQMNAGCWVFSAGTWQQLEIGRCYGMDPTAVHGAVNWGDAVRLHLMVDTETI